MRFTSFNINGIRARLHQVASVADQSGPIVIGFQETKVQDADFPLSAIEELNLDIQYYGQKAHYGVALASTQAPTFVQLGLPADTADSQRRFIRADYHVPAIGTVAVINCYFPQGESKKHETKFPAKEKFYQQVSQYIEDNFTAEDALILMGDFNVAPEDTDIGIGEDNKKRWLRTGKCSFLPEERAWYQRFFDWGLKDPYRHFYPDKSDVFSWFDYRSKGFDREPKRGLRIDMVLATQSVLNHVKEVGIDYEARAMEKPSDHCPVWIQL